MIPVMIPQLGEEEAQAAAEKLGFRAEIGLTEGLQGLVEWWRGSK